MNGIFMRDTAAKAAVLARAASLVGASKADPSATLMRWFGDNPSAERDTCGDWLTAVDPAGYRDAYRLFASEDGPSEAAFIRLGCPALFLTGEDELNSTPAMSQRMAELTPHGQAVVMTGAAHMLPMTHASQVNDVLQKFIEGVQHDAT